MKECIDFYSRLIIATITFAVPIIIYLLTTFSENLKKNKEELNRKKEALSKKAAEAIETDPDGTPTNLAEVIGEASKSHSEIEKAYSDEIEKIKPVKHFWWLFGFLLSAILFLLADFIVRDECRKDLYNHMGSIFLLTISLFFYTLAISYLIYLLHLINNTRKNLN